MSQQSAFAQEAIDLYLTNKRAIAHRYRGRGHAPLLGREHAEELFRSSISHIADRWSEHTPTSPYAEVYSRYVRQCTAVVWESTLAKLSQYFETYLREKRPMLPTKPEPLRKLARECLGKKAYFAVLYAVGGHFEVDLVLDSLCESAYRSVPEAERFKKVKKVRRRISSNKPARSQPAAVVPAPTKMVTPVLAEGPRTSVQLELKFS